MLSPRSPTSVEKVDPTSQFEQSRRITIVMPSATRTGGAEEALIQLLTSDAARAWQWQIAFLEPGPLVAALDPYVAETLVVRCGRTRDLLRWWRAAGEISQAAQRFKSQLIFGWMSKGHVYGGLAAWRTGLPAAWFQMGLPDSGSIERMSRLLPSNAVFACSEFSRELQHLKQPRAKVTAIPLGIDLARFDPEALPERAAARQMLGLPADVPIVGIVGRLQRWKGFHVLLDALPHVVEALPNVQAVLVGGPFASEPGHADELRRQADRLGVADSVTFAGMQENVPLWMHAMDVFVHASDREPLGLVIIEALALGKQVVACSPGGPDEILDGGKYGRLHRYADHRALAEQIVEALRAPLASTMELRKRAADYSTQTYASNLVAALADVLRCSIGTTICLTNGDVP